MKRRFQSGSVKRKIKSKRLQNESKGKWTLEQFGWVKPNTPSKTVGVNLTDLSVFDNNESNLEEVEENVIQQNSFNNENTTREGKGENLETEVGTHPSESLGSIC